jgi:hypothetical protein
MTTKDEEDGFLRHQYRQVAVILEQLCSTIEGIKPGLPGTPMFRITEADWLTIILATMSARKRLNALDAKFHHQPASLASSQQVQWSCSFCGRSDLDPKRLVVGHDSMICDECLVHYHSIVVREEQTPSATKQRLSRMFLASMCISIGNAMVPLSTHQQLLADKWNDAEFRASLNGALTEGVKRVIGVICALRYWANYLEGVPVPTVATEAVATGAGPHVGVATLLMPEPKLQMGPRKTIADTPVSDLTLNDLLDERERLCAERELGRPSPAVAARLEEILRRIQYLEWGCEI